jgi:CRP-like cAMP-binding protein
MSADANLLKNLYPLESLRPEHLEALAREAVEVTARRDEVLFSAGDTDESTMYLLDGDVRGDYPDGRTKSQSGGTSLQGRYAIGDLQPRRFTATVQSAQAKLVKIDRRFLEKVIAWDQVVKSGNVKHFDPNPEGNRWVFRLLQSKALRKLPVANVERLFTRFQEMDVKNAQTIIREGDDGDYFYVLKEGAAAVSQMNDSGESVVAYLVRGDSFGEDALLSNNVRNATVTMMKDGKLMRLAKSDFSELLKQPVVEWVSPGKASIAVRAGAGVIDVRTKEEFDERAIKGAANMPLSRLREFAAELDKSKRYITYCNSGERSAAAAFVLNKLGFDAAALQGGLSAMVRQMDQMKAKG